MRKPPERGHNVLCRAAFLTAKDQRQMLAGIVQHRQHQLSSEPLLCRRCLRLGRLVYGIQKSWEQRILA